MNKKLEEIRNSNFSLEAKFESMIENAKQIIKNDNSNEDSSLEVSLAYDVVSYLPKIIDNSISKEVIEEAIKKARLKMFSTRVMNEQEIYFLDKCVHVINDIENELLEEK